MDFLIFLASVILFFWALPYLIALGLLILSPIFLLISYVKDRSKP